MLKALRRVKETAIMSGQDADDKRKLSEIRDAASTLLKTLQFYYKTFLDNNANTAAVHEDIANLYPANQRLSVAVAHLHTENKVFTEANALADEVRKEMEPPLNNILARVKALTAVADQRAFARTEIEHYKDKVTKLANEGLADAKKQDKAESNQSKLKENQALFAKLDAELVAALAALDDEIANMTNAALAAFVSLKVAYSRKVLGVYSGALNLANGAGAGAAIELDGAADPSMSMAAFTGSGDAMDAPPVVPAQAEEAPTQYEPAPAEASV